MKLNKFLATLAVIFFLAGNTFAAVVVKEDGTYKGLVEVVNVTTGLDASVSGDAATISNSGSQVISGGTIDGTVIGGTTPAAGTFTTLRGSSGPAIQSTLTTNAVDAANSVWGVSGGINFEGTTADAFEGSLTLTDPTADRTWTMPDDTGTVALQSVAALTPGSTVTWNPASGSVFTLVPAQNETINMTATRAVSGAHTSLIVTTSGTTSYTLTFGTNFKSHGTLVTGTTTAIVYTVDFVYDGTNWNELARRRSNVGNIALTPSGTVAVDYAEGVNEFTDVPAQAQTLNAAVVGRAGQEFKMVFTTSGTTSYTLTFGTNFKTAGTLETGTTSGVIYTLEFISDGTNWNEIARRRDGSSVVALVAASPTVLDWAEGVDTYTLTPTGTVNINAPVVGRAGVSFDLYILTSGVSSFTETFNTNFKSTGTLATGTTTAKIFIVKFKSDGTTWNEVSRTTAM